MIYFFISLPKAYCCSLFFCAICTCVNIIYYYFTILFKMFFLLFFPSQIGFACESNIKAVGIEASTLYIKTQFISCFVSCIKIPFPFQTTYFIVLCNAQWTRVSSIPFAVSCIWTCETRELNKIESVSLFTPIKTNTCRVSIHPASSSYALQTLKIRTATSRIKMNIRQSAKDTY